VVVNVGTPDGGTETPIALRPEPFGSRACATGPGSVRRLAGRVQVRAGKLRRFGPRGPGRTARGA